MKLIKIDERMINVDSIAYTVRVEITIGVFELWVYLIGHARPLTLAGDDAARLRAYLEPMIEVVL